MVSARLHTRGEIKTQLGRLFINISNGEYHIGRTTANSLLNAIIRYNKTRCIKCDGIYDAFGNLDYLLLNCTNGIFKQKILYDAVETIVSLVQARHSDTLSLIRDIHADLRHYCYNLRDVADVSSITDCFEELADLKPEMNKVGGTVYNYYALMMQKIGDCETALMMIPQNAAVTDKMLQELSGKFSSLFAAMYRVVAPSVVIGGKEEIYHLAKAGVPEDELAQATGHTPEQLTDILRQAEIEATEGASNE